MTTTGINAAMIAKLCPDVAEAQIEKHLSRLTPDYLRRFDRDVIACHLHRIRALSTEHPVELILADHADRGVQCTVIAFDHPFEFSLITGVLASIGFRITSGSVFTFQPANRGSQAGGRRPAPGGMHRYGQAGPRATQRKLAAALDDPFQRRIIIDHFEGVLVGGRDINTWKQTLTKRMREVIGLLNQRDAQAVNDAKRRVNEWVTDYLHRHPPARDRGVDFENVQLNIRRTDRGAILKIDSPDTPAFLYSLSTALSLHRLSIDTVSIASIDDKVQDEIRIVGQRGTTINDPDTLEAIKFSVLLTKQFTFFLDHAPDPFAALQRFEQLAESIAKLPTRAEWTELFQDPRTMQDLAKLLGSSDFLWEDFIRANFETLLQLFQFHHEGKRFCESSESLAWRMEQALEPAIGLAEQRDRLNDFKDREVFLIDLDHILTPHADFRELSRHLTLLAENMVAIAAKLVFEDLVKHYGQPRNRKKQPAKYGVFGLGKLGGVALGYASDIELQFIYDEYGKTTGGRRDPIDNAAFFEHHARETAAFIKAKHEGIFEVDLRLRPYGKDGPLANSFEQFQSYYAQGGPAHAFEKLALVRLRWIAGDPALGYSVERCRNHFVYDQPDINEDDLWDIWNRQHQQKAKPGRLNAKYSPGALVDLECATQLLQVRHASSVPQLRSPRVSSVMEGLRRAGILGAKEFADMVGAYYFFRQLINALRMLRGDATDLFLPQVDSHECIYLARRMDYRSDESRTASDKLVDDFNARTAIVRDYIPRHLGRPCPGLDAG